MSDISNPMSVLSKVKTWCCQDVSFGTVPWLAQKLCREHVPWLEWLIDLIWTFLRGPRACMCSSVTLGMSKRTVLIFGLQNQFRCSMRTLAAWHANAGLIHDSTAFETKMRRRECGLQPGTWSAVSLRVGCRSRQNFLGTKTSASQDRYICFFQLMFQIANLESFPTLQSFMCQVILGRLKLDVRS